MKNIDYYFFKDTNISKYAYDIYHYTSPDGLLGILESNSFRFTHIYFLNDKSELRYTYDLLLELIEKQKANLNNNLYEQIRKRAEYVTSRDYLNSECEVLFREDFYVMSFSKDSDSLSLWNNYTKNLDKTGYCLKLTVNKLIDNIRKNKFDTFITNSLVCYNRQKQEDSLLSCIMQYNKKYTETTNEQETLSIIQDLMYEFIMYSLFFKHPKFQTENEYRVIIGNKSHIEEDNIQFRIKNGLFIPFLEIELPEKTDIVNRIIDEIKISPVHNEELTIYSLNKLLNKTGYKFLQITKSEIPLRF